MSLVETKAYRARLPLLSAEQSAQLRRWGEDNCWRSALTDEDAHTTWVAIREKKRSQAAWTRHVKEILKALGARRPDSRNWLELCTVQQARDITRQCPKDEMDDDDKAEGKVIALRDAKRRSAKASKTTFEIVRD